MAVRIDQILVQGDADDYRISIAQWMKIPIEVRMEIIREERASFLAAGEVVPVREAVSALKAQGAIRE